MDVRPCPHCNGKCFDCLSAVRVIHAGGIASAWCWGCGTFYEWNEAEEARTHPQISKRIPALLRSPFVVKMLRRWPMRAKSGDA